LPAVASTVHAGAPARTTPVEDKIVGAVAHQQEPPMPAASGVVEKVPIARNTAIDAASGMSEPGAPPTPIEDSTSLGSLASRIGARWRSIPSTTQRVMSGCAVGIVWALLELVTPLRDPFSRNLLILAADVAEVAAVGYVLAWVLFFCVPPLVRSQRRRIVAFWILAGFIHAGFTSGWSLRNVWFQLQERLFSIFEGNSRPGDLLVMFFLSLPEIAAGALTGWILSGAVGRRRIRGSALAGVFVIAAVAVRWSFVGLMFPSEAVPRGLIIGLLLHWAYWRAFTWGVVVPLSAFLEAAVVVAGMLWLAGLKPQTQPASGSAAD